MRAFTLVELLVVIVITALMVLLINTIFNDTFRAVSRGVQTSDIIADHRALGDQLERDAIEMLGPSDSSGPTTSADDAFLVILNKRVTHIRPGSDPDGVRIPDPTNRGQILTQPVRSDQLLFFRSAHPPSGADGEKLKSTTPINGNTYSSHVETALTSYSPAPGNYARVWYGHLDLTNADGTKNATTLVDATNGSMRDGWQWIVGRHALIFVGQTYEDNNGNAVNYNSYNRVDSPFYDGAIQSLPNNLNAGTDRLYMGTSDTTDWWLSSDETPLPPSTPGVRAPALIGHDRTLVTDPMNPEYRIYTGQRMEFDPNEVSYRAEAYRMTFGAERLRGNPFLPIAPDPWQFAQNHPVFMSNVSDFIVEFAADAVDDDADGAPDGGPDRDAATEEIIWYGMTQEPTWATFYTHNPNDPNNGTTAEAISPNADSSYVWRHDYYENWPYLIRIRYRQHDLRGDLTTAKYDTTSGEDRAESGKWFEVVIKVNRPVP